MSDYQYNGYQCWVCGMWVPTGTAYVCPGYNTSATWKCFRCGALVKLGDLHTCPTFTNDLTEVKDLLRRILDQLKDIDCRLRRE